MNLLELMLHEEIEWPSFAKLAVQDDNGLLKWSKSGERPSLGGAGCWHRGNVSGSDPEFGVIEVSDDWSTRIITREEYQAAGGWMKWEGGKRPVSSGSMVNFVARGDVVILVGKLDP